jgi:hypothetical protein
MDKKTIIVSAFISNGNTYRKMDDYINYGKALLQLEVNTQIIFIEKNIFNEYLQEYASLDQLFYFEYKVNDSIKAFEYIVWNNRIFVFFEKEDIYLHEYKDKLTEFLVFSDNPHKDTIDYMFIQNHKTEWIKMAIYLMQQKEENTVENYEFMWVDFGICHMINNDILNNELKNLENRNALNPHTKIRIGGCWDLNLYYYVDVFTQIAWYFAGSVFGGSTNELIEFADLMKEKCLQIIEQKRTLMWEVNVWYLIYLERRHLFDHYYCGHDASIIMNY